MEKCLLMAQSTAKAKLHVLYSTELHAQWTVLLIKEWNLLYQLILNPRSMVQSNLDNLSTETILR